MIYVTHEEIEYLVTRSVEEDNPNISIEELTRLMNELLKLKQIQEDNNSLRRTL